jgi:hypothetical protein
MFNCHLSLSDAPSALHSKKKLREAPPQMTIEH